MNTEQPDKKSIIIYLTAMFEVLPHQRKMVREAMVESTEANVDMVSRVIYFLFYVRFVIIFCQVRERYSGISLRPLKKKLEFIIPARVKFALRVKFFFIFNIFFISHFTALGILFQCHISFCTHIHCINVVLVMWSYCKTFHKSTTPFGRTVIKKALLLQGQKPCCTKITTEDK